MSTMQNAQDTLQQRMADFLRCPTEEALAEVEGGLKLYQSAWIRGHAGVPAATASATAETPPPPRRRAPRLLPAGDAQVLERLAEGWTPTTAEVKRWAWFENRGYVHLVAGPDGAERLYLTPDGWQAVGREPPV